MITTAVSGVAWRRSPIIGAAALLVILLSLLLFTSLSITIRDGVLSSHFGFGFWTKRFLIADIADASLATWS